MGLSDLAALGEAIGGFAVMVTLIYLAYQFRQTSIVERTAGQRELLARCRDWVELTTVHAELVDVLRKTFANWDDGTPEEKERANGWMLSAALQAEQALYMKRAGLINEASYQGFLGAVVAIAATPGGSVWWSQARNALGADVVVVIDEALSKRSVGALSWTDIFPHLQVD